MKICQKSLVKLKEMVKIGFEIKFNKTIPVKSFAHHIYTFIVLLHPYISLMHNHLWHLVEKLFQNI